jgi:hypothetical protein
VVSHAGFWPKRVSRRLVLGSLVEILFMTEPRLGMHSQALGLSLILGPLSQILEPLFLIPGPKVQGIKQVS